MSHGWVSTSCEESRLQTPGDAAALDGSETSGDAATARDEAQPSYYDLLVEACGLNATDGAR